VDDKKPIAIIAAVIVAVVGGGIWWYSRPAPPPTNTTPVAVNATEAPVDKPAPPVNLPPLDQMDAFLRPLLSALSSRPELVKWLATDDLIGQLAMAIDQASEGDSPARDLKVIKPGGTFRVAGRGQRRSIDPASYRRYDSLVQTLTSIDAAAAAKVYKTIRPRLNEAYQRAGNPGRSVDPATQQALDILLDTPIVKDPIPLVETGATGWAYEDPALEELTMTQKQLLRMGAANAERVQAWLRAFQIALQ
jgi:hypothetical protein